MSKEFDQVKQLIKNFSIEDQDKLKTRNHQHHGYKFNRLKVK